MALLLGAAAPVGQETTIADALDQLQLTPQQIVSLREFFGQFGRDSKIFGTTTGDGTAVLDLRDPKTNDRLGQLIMRINADGSVSVARLSGDAKFDSAHAVVLPLFADSKKRDEIKLAMATSAAGTVNPETPTAPLPFMQTQRLMRVTLNPPDPKGIKSPATIITASIITQAQATFFPDGSGFASGIRATALGADAPKDVRVPTLHLFGRYLSKLESDGLRVFRAKTVELAGDVAMSFDAFEARLACAAPGRCGAVWSLAAPDIASSLHVMRKENATVPRAPLDLVTSLAPPLDPAQSIPALTTQNPTMQDPATQNPTTQNPVTAVLTPPPQTQASTPPGTQTLPALVAPSQQIKTGPERDEIGSALQGSSAPQPGGR